jgi:hypothetical protein
MKLFKKIKEYGIIVNEKGEQIKIFPIEKHEIRFREKIGGKRLTFILEREKNNYLKIKKRF